MWNVAGERVSRVHIPSLLSMKKDSIEDRDEIDKIRLEMIEISSFVNNPKGVNQWNDRF